jgi:hypothetical protein
MILASMAYFPKTQGMEWFLAFSAAAFVKVGVPVSSLTIFPWPGLLAPGVRWHSSDGITPMVAGLCNGIHQPLFPLLILFGSCSNFVVEFSNGLE